MRQLLKNYFGLIKKPAEIYQIDFADAIFFDGEISVQEKINHLNSSINEGRVELIPRVAALERFLPANFNQ